MYKDRVKAWRYICYFKPIIVILSPECKGFSIVMNANWGKMSADQVDYIMDICFAMWVFSIQVAIHQVDNNRFYILEHFVELFHCVWRLPRYYIRDLDVSFFE